ncbi:MAG: SPOR domain-containing protein [Cardiobacteriaceae bacterium]|nr:SPOR domain-containing protein [Cardiobacteriaceae bacterium]
MSKSAKKRVKSAQISNSSRVAARLLGGFIMFVVIAVAGFVGYHIGIKKDDVPRDPPRREVSANTPAVANNGNGQGREAQQRKARYSFYDELKKRSNEVEAEVAAKSKELAAAPDVKGAYYRVQVGAFKEKEQAERLRARLILRDFPVSIVHSNNFHLVQVGPYQKREEAQKIEETLKKSGFNVLLKKFESN